MELDEWLPPVVEYLPTVLFIFIVVLYTYLGYKRGLRKSLIFLAYSIVSLVIIISLFIFLSSNNIFNYKSVEILNKINGQYWLQNTLGVNISRDNLSDILTELVLKNTNASIIDVALYSGPYVVALVQALVRLILAICLLVVHFVFKIIYYIFYLIFHKDSRYIKKLNSKYASGLEPNPYMPRRKISLLIGLFRGLVCALAILSIAGAPLYLVYYNSNYLDNVNIESEDETAKTTSYTLKELSKYGNSGIYKILNSVKDKNDVPYYLLVCDLVMQGKIEDTNTNYNKNVYFYQELIKYRSFIDDSIDLILKYDTENLIINDINSLAFDNIYNHLLTIFSSDSFQAEFGTIIQEFDKDTYLIDVAYSVLNGIVVNIDSFDFGNDDVKEIFKILFKKGYKSSEIAYEANLDSNQELPYISIRDLISKDDLDEAVSLYFAYVKTIEEANYSDTNFVLDLISNMSNDIKKFSMFKNKKDNVNGAFRRLYAYVSNKYLNSSDNFIETTIYNSKYDNVSWVDETYTLCDCLPNILNIYKTKLKDIDYSNTDFVDLIFSLVDSDTLEDYNKSREALLTSDILEVAINSGLVRNILKDSLDATYNNFAYPDEVDVLETLKIIDYVISDSDNKEAFKYINETEFNSTNFDTFVTNYNILFDSELISYASESNLFRSIITSAFKQNASEYLYFDQSIFEVDSSGEIINRLSEEECYNFLNNANYLFEIATPFVKKTNDYTNINKYLENEFIIDVLESSKFIEGSISKLVFEKATLSFEKPNSYLYVTGETDSEIKKLATSICMLNLDFDDIDKSSYDTVYETLKEKTDNDVETIFLSDVIYLNIAAYIEKNKSKLFNGLITPNSVYNSSEYNTYIKKDVIVGLIIDISKIWDESLSTNELINLFAQNKKIFKYSAAKDILNATLANKIVSDSSIRKNLNLTSLMEEKGSSSSLTTSFNSNNIWYEEGYNLLTALDEFSDEAGNVLIDNIINNVKNDFSTLNKTSKVKGKNVIEVLYNSNVLKYNISNEISKELENNIDSSILDSTYIKTYDNTIKASIISCSETSKLISCAEALELKLNSSMNVEISVLDEYYNNRKKLEYVLDSKIACALVSVNIEKELNDNNINTPLRALVSSDINIYKESEIRTLVNLVNHYDISEINSISVSDVLDLLYSGQAVQSYVLFEEVSNEILSIENIVVVKDDYNTTYSTLKDDAVYIMLKSLIELDVKSLQEDVFDNVSLSASNLNYTLQSLSVRASIPHILEIDFAGISSDIMVLESSAIKKVDYNNNTIYIMSENELLNCVKQLNNLNVYNSKKTVSENDILSYIVSSGSNLYSSEIIHISISNIIDQKTSLRSSLKTFGYTLSKTTNNCINLYNYQIIEKNIYTVSK